MKNNDIYQSPFVKDPVLLWNQENGITQEGQKFLNEKENEA